MKIQIDLDVNPLNDRCTWNVRSDSPQFDGAHSADSLDAALADAAAWIKENDH